MLKDGYYTPLGLPVLAAAMRPSFYNLTPLRRYVPLRHNAGCPHPLLKGFLSPPH